MECSAVLCHFRGCQDASVCRQEGCFKHCLPLSERVPASGCELCMRGKEGGRRATPPHAPLTLALLSAHISTHSSTSPKALDRDLLVAAQPWLSWAFPFSILLALVPSPHSGRKRCQSESSERPLPALFIWVLYRVIHWPGKSRLLECKRSLEGQLSPRLATG